MATAQSATTRSLVGTVLSRRWRVVHKLGEGGMGEVFAAEPIEGGARVALKVLRPEFVGNAPVLSRFLEEARTSMRLVHPNIVRVLEGAQAEDGAPYLVMELLDGVPLGAYTQNGGRVPLAQAVPILQGILAGLTAAHSQGIVHRDLKPDNVLLTRDAAGTFVVKVLDFGIAKVMDVVGGMSFRTRTGALLGTPAYMSPEQARSARDVDQRADLWSAGVLFYEMLTGRSAFPAPTEYARLAALLTTEPEPVARIDPALAPLTGFFERALKKDRQERFASSTEMARALAAAVPHLGARTSGAPAPLSRLPDVPSTYVGQFAAVPRTAALPKAIAQQEAGPVPTHVMGGGQPQPSAAPALVAHTAPVAAAEPKTTSLAQERGSTLASPTAPAGPGVVDPPSNIAFAGVRGTFGETLPSPDNPPRSSRAPERARSTGVSMALVIVLIVVALGIGFFLGVAVDRI